MTGWYDIIYDLSKKLEDEIHKIVQEYKSEFLCGQCGHKEEEHKEFPKLITSQWGNYTIDKHDFYANIPRASQVKEKFGGLRFYMTSYSDTMSDLIAEAEAKSTKTCESCGLNGELHISGGWLKTLCGECAIQENENKDRIVSYIKYSEWCKMMDKLEQEENNKGDNNGSQEEDK